MLQSEQEGGKTVRTHCQSHDDASICLLHHELRTICLDIYDGVFQYYHTSTLAFRAADNFCTMH